MSGGFLDVLRGEPDAAAIRAAVEEARGDDRLPEAVAALKDLYARSGSPAAHAALRGLLTLPEFEALPAFATGTRRRWASHLPSLFVYPFSSVGGASVLLLGGPLFAAAERWWWAWPLLGYVAAHLFTVVVESARGSDRAPGWPDAEEWPDWLVAFLKWWVPVLLCFAPAGFFVVLWLRSGALDLLHPWLAAAASAALLGLAYYPMAMLMAAMSGAWWSPVNLRLGLGSIARLGGDYLACAALLLAITVAVIAIAVLTRDVPVSWIVPSKLLGGWTTYALYVVQMRAIGLLYRTRAADLAWYR